MKKITKTGLVVGVIGAAALLGVMAMGAGGQRSVGDLSSDEFRNVLRQALAQTKAGAAFAGMKILTDQPDRLVLFDEANRLNTTITVEEHDGSVGLRQVVVSVPPEGMIGANLISDDFVPVQDIMQNPESYGSLAIGKIKACRGPI